MLIEQTLTKFCIAKGIEATSERIKIQAGYLRKSGFKEKEIVDAINELFGETPFFPDASMILKKLKPSTIDIDTEANLIAGKIVESISSIGPYRIADAKEYIGTIGWHVVQRFGGWNSLCQISYSELSTVRAQLRMLASSIVRSKHFDGLEYSQNEKNEIKSKEKAQLVLLKDLIS